ncbi:transposase [Thalassospira alkalitolerans]|uniref:transposase n=1 Tax=Thalassospira alkalitolerans TaxID=1293890 RepID=UPI003AA8FAB1
MSRRGLYAHDDRTGVGPIAALTFKAAVDDPSRFRRSRTVAAHFGLTPRRFQSGSTTILDEYRRQEIEMFVQLYMQPPTHC